MSTKFCELGQGADASREEHETLFSPELDEQMSDMQNVTKQIERQLQLNVVDFFWGGGSRPEAGGGSCPSLEIPTRKKFPRVLLLVDFVQQSLNFLNQHPLINSEFLHSKFFYSNKQE